jgi:acyl-CoA synthetase (NDP forming)
MIKDIKTLLSPSSIAIIGASSDVNKFGGRLVEVLQLHGFPGKIYPINPRRLEIFGLPAYPTLRHVPEQVDTAVLCVPQSKVLEAFDDCAAKGVALCIVISAQFAEAGQEGRELEEELKRRGQRYGVRILGPNCLGFISRSRKIVLIPSPALYAHVPMPPGRIGMVSQSGGLLATVFDIAVGLGLGFTHGITVGNQLDLTAADFVRFLADDPETGVICCYVEGVKDFSEFAAALTYARNAGKPVVILKAGRTPEGGAAALTHTASLASDYEIFAAYIEGLGAVAVDDPRVMLIVADLLDRYGNIPLEDVVVVTNSGGGAAIVADRLHDVGLNLDIFSDTLTKRLSEFYFASHARNPLDWGGTELSSEDELLEKSFSALFSTAGSRFLLVVFFTNPNMKRTAEILARHVERAKLPYLFLVIPDKAADVSREVLRQHRMPYVDSIDDALRAMVTIRAYGRRHPSGARTTAVPAQRDRPPFSFASARFTEEGLLDAASSFALLSHYGIRMATPVFATSCDDAVRLAASVGYPIALKIDVADIAHKSDVGGVELDVEGEPALRAAWDRISASLARLTPGRRLDGVLVQPMIADGVECFVGVKNEFEIGPIVMFGAGGVFVELLRDHAVVTVPCDPVDVRQRLASLSIARLLAGYRGRPSSDVEAYLEMIVRLGHLAHDLRDRLIDLDLNPVILGAKGQGAIAVDVRARFRPEAGTPDRQASGSLS